MTGLQLNVIGLITKNQSVYFLEQIKINASIPTAYHKFEIQHQHIQHHPIFEKKINKKKNKQEVYLCLGGDDLLKYYDIVSQKFHFNQKYLEPVGLVDLLKYSTLQNPDRFIEKFEESHLKESNVVKIELLLKSIDPSDSKILIKFAGDGYQEFLNKFKQHFLKKHLARGRALLTYTQSSPLATFVEKKIEYYHNYLSSTNFNQFFNSMILLLLPDEVVSYLSRLEVNDIESLKISARLYDNLSSHQPQQNNVIVAPVLLNPTSPFSESDCSNILPAEATSIDCTVRKSDVFPVDWMNQLGDKQTAFVIPSTRNNIEFREKQDDLTEKDRNLPLENILLGIQSTKDPLNNRPTIPVTGNTQLNSSAISPTSASVNPKFKNFTINTNEKFPLVDFEKTTFKSKKASTNQGGKRTQSSSTIKHQEKRRCLPSKIDPPYVPPKVSDNQKNDERLMRNKKDNNYKDYSTSEGSSFG